MRRVDIACSVSHLESIVGASGGMLVTFSLVLHSGVMALMLIAGEVRAMISADAVLRGLGVFGVLRCDI